MALAPLTAQSLDLAGAFISPLFALVGGWFLWWWLRRFPVAGRYAALLVYTLSAILVHGTALGRPDHQSLLIVLLLVALAAEWILDEKPSVGWSVASGLAWGLALWVSLYEPLILLGTLALFSLARRGANWISPPRRTGWFVFLGVVALAALIERRWPEWPAAEPFFSNWSATIGELKHVGLTNRIWFDWCGGLLPLSPLLLFVMRKNRTVSWAFLSLFILTLCLTMWEARWGYFFALIFLLTLPAQIAVVRQRWIAWTALALILLPFLIFWDTQFWPNEKNVMRQAENRMEMAQWRAAASSLASSSRARSLRRGGSRLPRPIVRPADGGWQLARKFIRHRRNRAFLSTPHPEKRKRFCESTRCNGFWYMTPTGLRRIPPRSWGAKRQGNRFAAFSTVFPRRHLVFWSWPGKTKPAKPTECGNNLKNPDL